MNENYSVKLLRGVWIANAGFAAAMVLTLILIRTGEPVPRTPATEAWFYANALINFTAIAVGLYLHFLFGRRLRTSTFRTEALRYAYLYRFALVVPLYAATLFASVATIVGGEIVNLLFTVTFFAAAMHFYPSSRRILKDVLHAQNGA